VSRSRAQVQADAVVVGPKPECHRVPPHLGPVASARATESDAPAGGRGAQRGSKSGCAGPARSRAAVAGAPLGARLAPAATQEGLAVAPQAEGALLVEPAHPGPALSGAPLGADGRCYAVFAPGKIASPPGQRGGGRRMSLLAVAVQTAARRPSGLAIAASVTRRPLVARVSGPGCAYVRSYHKQLRRCTRARQAPPAARQAHALDPP
jgi:hypothetical protein